MLPLMMTENDTDSGLKPNTKGSEWRSGQNWMRKGGNGDITILISQWDKNQVVVIGAIGIFKLKNVLRTKGLLVMIETICRMWPLEMILTFFCQPLETVGTIFTILVGTAF